MDQFTLKHFKQLIAIIVVGLLMWLTYPEVNSWRHINHIKPVALKSDNNSFYTFVAINGTSIGEAQVDTGSYDVSISQDIADKIRLDWRYGPKEEYSLADGSTVVCRSVNDKITVGTLTRVAQISVCPSGAPLLGMSFLRQIKVSIEHDTMTME